MYLQKATAPPAPLSHSHNRPARSNRPAVVPAPTAPAAAHLGQCLVVQDVCVPKLVAGYETDVWRVTLACGHATDSQEAGKDARGHALTKRHQAVLGTRRQVLQAGGSGQTLARATSMLFYCNFGV
eukprot:GHRQ01020014.1.p2 GENE.GHRQ01020014.1~~GHRQ01020014.1.p2  ORF type:complete len:126 (-),score=6.48 GHRQ01020014.1:672-1049(-)